MTGEPIVTMPLRPWGRSGLVLAAWLASLACFLPFFCFERLARGDSTAFSSFGPALAMTRRWWRARPIFRRSAQAHIARSETDATAMAEVAPP